MEILEFSATLILCEINYRDSRCSKTAVVGILEALKFHFHKFVQFLKGKIGQKSKFRVRKIAKIAVFELLESLKLISRKI